MFILRSTHENLVTQAEISVRDQVSSMYESRISDLKAQIEDLKKLIFIPRQEQTPESYEVDAVISGSDKPIEISEEEHNRILQISREADLIASGNYDEELLN